MFSFILGSFNTNVLEENKIISFIPSIDLHLVSLFSRQLKKTKRRCLNCCVILTLRK